MSARAIAALVATILCVSVAGCSGPGHSSQAVPTTPTPSATLDSFVGTWSSTPSLGGATLPNACSALKYDITRAADNQSATVSFNATCAGFVIAGTGAGSLAGSTLTWSSAGTISQNGSPFCAFDFKNNTATPEGTDAIRVNYSGTVCGVPVAGSQVVHR